MKTRKMKTYYEETLDNTNAMLDSINNKLEEGEITPEAHMKSIEVSLFIALVLNTAHIADELYMLREAIEKKERLADK